MVIAIICQETGWTYEEYLNQPTWLIELICSKMELDAQALKKLK